MRHGYTNRTQRRASVVRKTYAGPGAGARQAAEYRALTALAEVFTVPGIANSGPGWIETEFVTGRHGQDLIDAGDATAVLSECGHALAELHRIDPRLLDPAAPPRTVIRHGDFGPNNVLLDADTGATSAVLDWEFSGVGNVLADVAWCEWIVRMHHPTAIDALDDFFDAYGQRPSWTDRQQEMVRRCEWLEDFACRGDPDGPGVETWRQRRRIAEAWTE